MFESADFSDLTTFGVAHAQNGSAGTGCTVFLSPEGAVCGSDIRGGGPATRETDLLRPENMVEKVNGVVLSGGSAFGLEASCGVMEVLADEGYGFAIGNVHVPIVPGACLFDLLVGEPIWPDKAMGAEAAAIALANWKTNSSSLERGNVGAGCGASVGKLGLPQQAMKSGFGWCGLKAGELAAIACVALNACGNVSDGKGGWIAGVLDDSGIVRDPLEAASGLASAAKQPGSRTPATNTTLGVVLTNADLTKAQATKVAQIAQDGYARAIKPVHTLNDGDAIFAMCSGEVQAQTDFVCMLAAEAMERAVRDAAESAVSAYGLPGLEDSAAI